MLFQLYLKIAITVAELLVLELEEIVGEQWEYYEEYGSIKSKFQERKESSRAEEIVVDFSLEPSPFQSSVISFILVEILEWFSFFKIYILVLCVSAFLGNHPVVELTRFTQGPTSPEAAFWSWQSTFISTEIVNIEFFLVHFSTKSSAVLLHFLFMRGQISHFFRLFFCRSIHMTEVSISHF